MKRLMLIALVSCCYSIGAMEGEMFMPKYDDRYREHGSFDGWPLERHQGRKKTQHLQTIKKSFVTRQDSKKQ